MSPTRRLPGLLAAMAVLVLGATALATSSVTVRLSVEDKKLYADVSADGKDNTRPDEVRVYYLRGDDTTKHMLKERNVKGEVYRERLFVTEAKKGERIRVVIESEDSGKRISESDSWPK